MNDSWIIQLHQELLRLRGNGPGWGNRPGGAPYVEPTALASLALAASDPHTGAERSRAAVRAAAEWLASLQQRDGALGIAPDLPHPRWTTPLGVLVWSACGQALSARNKAVNWLLARQGTTWTPNVAEPFGHDPRIPGWPWVEGTHSWLEPTAMAVLALRRAGHAEHQRSRDGLCLIRDRAIRTGGWNYGNSTVFGADLRPHPAPTGLALLALAGIDDSDSAIVERSCDYLDVILPATHAPQSLCFGILALTAWGRRPAAADDWLIAAHAGAARRSNSIAQIAYLLLAAGAWSLDLLGVTVAGFPKKSNVEAAVP
ncbi:MAG: hypothetical protein ACM3U2_09220 [Deltaproteobacteria bacterium]